MNPSMEVDEQGLPLGYRFRLDWELSPRQVQTMREGGEAHVLIDCRTEQEFAIAAIEGATLIPLHEAGARLEELKQLATQRVVIYCHHGMRSLQLASFLRQQGVSDAYSLAGGIDAWAMSVEPGMRRY